VIDRFKTKTFSEPELSEHKNVFATSYFLTQETHSSLASALSNALYYHGKAIHYYDFAKEIENVTSQDIHRLANAILVNPRVGVIFNRKKFADQWALDFINKNEAKSQAPIEKKT
jgi:predicted Zn-dependent peptidase